MTQTLPSPGVTPRAATSPAAPSPRIALVGVHGYGERHLANLARLEAAGALELVAVADPNPPSEGQLNETVAVFDTLDQLLAAGTAPDVVILATPIQTHAPLALAALAAGADVYVEKPPMASMAQHQEVLEAASAAGRRVQVGFQSLGSHALPAIGKLIAEGGIGEVRGFGATGTWLRTLGYFKRSRWAGKRSLDGTDVVDGVATNALAHAVATALKIAGARRTADVESVETDLYRAHNTESDDTSVIRVRTSSGKVLTCALTLCAPEQTRPSVTVYGTLGQAEFFYTEDELVITTAAGERREVFGRTDLLENLLAARGTGEPLLSPLPEAGAYMAVLEAIRTAPAPAEIAAEHVVWEGTGEDAHPVVTDITEYVRRAVLAQATFAELGAPWARQIEPSHTFSVAGRAVASYLDGGRIRPTSSPRPYLHPVRTLSGTVVTDHQPSDHVWHLGAGVALQDVNGINFWGGRTYTRDAGAYVWRPDHGSISRLSVQAAEASLDEVLSWDAPDGQPVLTEQRSWAWDAIDSSVWRLRLDFALSPAGDEPVFLGSPGSNGRFEGGYGGFFWRLPHCSAPDVRTASAHGEAEVHGTVAPWLAWSAEFDGGAGAVPSDSGAGSVGAGSGGAGSGGAGSSKAATLVFVSAQGCSDPWFVRVDGYPGVGQSLAWDRPVSARKDSPVERSITVLVADGRLENSDIETLIKSLGEHS